MMLDIKLAELSSSGEEASKVYPIAFLIGTPFLWTLTGSPLFRGDTLYSWFDQTTLGIAHISDPSALQWTNLFAAFSNIHSLGAQLYYALIKLAVPPLSMLFPLFFQSLVDVIPSKMLISLKFPRWTYLKSIELRLLEVGSTC
ncbi:NADH dehydrogenase subunit 6 [Rhizophagus irregularis DAOM 181602=DAOM 197198]|nr:NADH dehydrogenase subunit 6 [Rhizophagus irregularis DAOM 181602=DAOM 197198]